MYKVYLSLLAFVAKNIRTNAKKLGIKTQLDKADYLTALKEFIKIRPELLSSMDFIILCDEMDYYLHPKESNSYFVKDEAAYNAINNVKISKLDATLLITENENFTVNIPNSIGIPGLFVSVRDADDFRKRIQQVHKTYDENIRNVHGTCVSITYATCGLANYDGHIEATLPTAMINDIIAADSYEHYKEIVPICSLFGAVDLDDTDKRAQFDIVKFVAKFMLYRAAAPERFVEGCPNNQPMPRLMASTRTKTFSIPANTSSVREHYRSPTLRQLRDERFYHGEYAHMKPGSRIVFVKDSFVNANKVNVQTAQAM